MDAARSSSTVRFGVFEVDLRSGELRKQGMRIKLHEQPFQILAMLLERPGDLVAREEIQKKLWSHDTVVEFDHSINAAIKRLREALDDSADNPRFVETVARRGYRFIAPVHGSVVGVRSAVGAEQSHASQAHEPGVAAVRRRTSEQVAWMAAAVLLGATVVLGFVYLRRSRAPTRPIVSHILPPEGSSFFFVVNYAGPPVVSPDGARLAFVAPKPEESSGSKNVIWVRALDFASAHPLAHTDGASFPFWSSDSRFLGFFAEGKLKKIDASGGPPQILCDVAAGRGGSWSRDGAIVFSPGGYDPIYRVSATGGPPMVVTKLGGPDRQNSHRWPYFLPDGRHFLYFGRAGSLEHTGTYVASLDGKEQKLLLRGDANAIYAPPGYLLFVRESKLMAQPFDAERLRLTGSAFPIAEPVLVSRVDQRAVVSVSENQILAYQTGNTGQIAWSLAWFDRTGKQGEIVGEPGGYFWPRLSPDGQRLAVVVCDPVNAGNADIWVYDLSRRLKTRLTFNSSLVRSPVWSQDGIRIAFGSNHKGSLSHIYQKSANGMGGEELLLETSADEWPMSLSSDGRHMAYGRREEASGGAKWSVWILPLFGDRKPFPFVKGDFDAWQPAFSPDGQWVAYMSNESGPNEVYVVPFPRAEGKRQVSTAGGYQPRWRRDGKELFFVSTDNKLVAADITTERAKLEIGTVRPLFTIRVPSLGDFMYDVAPDGKHFLVVKADQQPNPEPVTLVVNWTAGLKR